MPGLPAPMFCVMTVIIPDDMMENMMINMPM